VEQVVEPEATAASNVLEEGEPSKSEQVEEAKAKVEDKQEEEKKVEEPEEIEPGRILYGVMYTQDSVRERPTLFSD